MIDEFRWFQEREKKGWRNLAKIHFKITLIKIVNSFVSDQYLCGILADDQALYEALLMHTIDICDEKSRFKY